jgi:ribosome maturation factor RimP
MPEAEGRRSASQIEAQLYGDLEPLGLEVVDLIYRQEGGSLFLRIFVDEEGGATIATCTRATKLIRQLPWIESLPYDYLEVSSPGLDRIIKKDRDFVRFAGAAVKIKCRSPLAGKKQLQGVLGRAGADTVELITEQDTLLIPKEIIISVRLQP